MLSSNANADHGKPASNATGHQRGTHKDKGTTVMGP